MAKRQIEVCSNNEWIADGWDLRVWENEAAEEWFGEVCRRIDDEFGFDTSIAARGQRRMCHGWNGANTFSRKESGLGTFDVWTDEEWGRAVAIADEVASDVQTRWQNCELQDDLNQLREAVESGDEDTAVSAWDHMTDWHGLEESDERIAGFSSKIDAWREALA